MISAHFDTQAFMKALDSVRSHREMTWYQIWHETGIDVSTLKRMIEGKQACSVHTLATLALWSAIDVRQFFCEEVI